MVKKSFPWSNLCRYQPARIKVQNASIKGRNQLPSSGQWRPIQREYARGIWIDLTSLAFPRPDNHVDHDCVNLLCYAEFLRYFYLAAKPQDNDWHPVKPSDDRLENNFSNKIYPSIIPLMTCKDKLKCTKVPSAFCLFAPNKDKDYELYAHHLLMPYCPVRKELKSGSLPSYTNKIAEADFLQIVNQNRQKV